jgi:hypothetical protein
LDVRREVFLNRLVRRAAARPTLLLVKVHDPFGQTWRITRRWVPWRRRRKAELRTPTDLAPSGLGEVPAGAIVFLVCLVIAIPLLVLAAIAGVQLLLLVLLAPFALLGRAAFGRNWIVEARKGYAIWWETPAGDWQASMIKIHEIADEIRIGVLPPRTVDAEP